MPFGNMTSGSNVFEPRSPGIYSLTSVGFSDPQNEIRVRGAVPSKDGLLRANIIRVLQKDVVVGSNSSRLTAQAQLQVVIPRNSSFTASNVDEMIADLSTVLTPAIVSRWLQGES